jgi:hypothetical protein
MSKNTVNDLFQTANEQGDISDGAMQALQVVDVGNQIQEGLGISVDDVTASEVVLVTIMPDDSSSMYGNTQLAIDGHNLVLDALTQSKQQDSILAHNRYLNGNVLYPYSSIEQAVRMTSGNYSAHGGTPLYDQTVLLLGTVLAKTQEFSDNGVPVRTVTLIITDGADMGSNRADAKMVNKLVTDMLRTENHIVAAMGIDDGGYTDFRQVFKEMGIPDNWILTPGNNESEIRKAFQVFSQSAVRVSQSAQDFSQTAIGGFGT